MSEEGKWVKLGGEKVKRRSKPIRLDDEPTPELILKLIDHHRDNELDRYKRLQNYYEGYSDIILRKKDDTKPNNKLVSGYPSYIVDLFQGMMVGKPITYTSAKDDIIAEVQSIFDYNDEQDENSELTKMAGIKGKAYEILFIDENSKVRFNEVDADNVIMVYDTKLIPEPNFAIRYYYTTDIDNLDDEDGILKAVLYTKDEIIEYTKSNNNKLVEDNKSSHTFKDVPVIEILNNDEGIGDFERVISYIDAYEKAVSDSSNDLEEFTDAFLVLAGMMGTTPEDARKLKEDKILLTDGEKQSAYWLIKEINDVATENHKNRLNADIHKFAKVPDMSDEKFAGNISGESMKYKLMPMDQVIAAKQRKYKRAMQKRIELITNHLTVKDKEFDYRDIVVKFAHNKPINEKEWADMAIALMGIVSTSTAIGMIPFIEDPNEEMEKIELEKQAYIDLSDDEEEKKDITPEKILELIPTLPEEYRDDAISLLDKIRGTKDE